MTSPKKQRGPKGRVMWADPYFAHNPTLIEINNGFEVRSKKLPQDKVVFAMVECPTAKAARDIVRLHGWNRDDMLCVVTSILRNCHRLGSNHGQSADAVLLALGLKGR